VSEAFLQSWNISCFFLVFFPTKFGSVIRITPSILRNTVTFFFGLVYFLFLPARDSKQSRTVQRNCMLGMNGIGSFNL
jgi:hypothetical protein